MPSLRIPLCGRATGGKLAAMFSPSIPSAWSIGCDAMPLKSSLSPTADGGPDIGVLVFERLSNFRMEPTAARFGG